MTFTFTFIHVPKKGSSKECSNHGTVVLVSHDSKVMLKILHTRLQHYATQELPDIQVGFRKDRGTRDQIANLRWIIEKARNSRKTSISVSLIMLSLYCVDHKLDLKEMGIPAHLTCFLRNLYVGLEATVVPCMEQVIGSGLRRSMTGLSTVTLFIYSTLWEMLGWMSYKLESR